jgi:hypothetical protein
LTQNSAWEFFAGFLDISSEAFDSRQKPTLFELNSMTTNCEPSKLTHAFRKSLGQNTRKTVIHFSGKPLNLLKKPITTAFRLNEIAKGQSFFVRQYFNPAINHSLAAAFPKFIAQKLAARRTFEWSETLLLLPRG